MEDDFLDDEDAEIDEMETRLKPLEHVERWKINCLAFCCQAARFSFCVILYPVSIPLSLSLSFPLSLSQSICTQIQ